MEAWGPTPCLWGPAAVAHVRASSAALQLDGKYVSKSISLPCLLQDYDEWDTQENIK